MSARESADDNPDWLFQTFPRSWVYAVDGQPDLDPVRAARILEYDELRTAIETNPMGLLTTAAVEYYLSETVPHTEG